MYSRPVLRSVSRLFRRVASPVFLAGAVSWNIHAIAPDADTREPSRAEHRKSAESLFSELTEGFREDGRKAHVLLRDAAPQDEEDLRARIFDEYRRKSQEIAERLLRLADTQDGASVAVESLLWVIDHRNSLPQAERAAKKLIEEHLEDPSVERYILDSGCWVWKTDEQLLRGLITNSRSAEVTARATLRLAKTLALKSTWSRQLAADSSSTLANILESRRPLGPGVVAHLRSVNADSNAEAAGALFRGLRELFSDLPYGAPRARQR